MSDDLVGSTDPTAQSDPDGSDKIFDDPDACFLWELAKDADGYGVVRRNGKTQRAHRAAWEAIHGPIPPGMVLLHSCDTPACIKVEHLSVGTQADNVRDMVQKGRNSPPPRRK